MDDALGLVGELGGPANIQRVKLVRVMSTGSGAGLRLTTLVLNSHRVGHKEIIGGRGIRGGSGDQIGLIMQRIGSEVGLVQRIAGGELGFEQLGGQARQRSLGSRRFTPGKIYAGRRRRGRSICIRAAADINTSIGFWRGFGTG